MKCERWIDEHDTSVGQRKNPRQEFNPWPPEHWAGALSTELQELMESKKIVTKNVNWGFNCVATQ